MTVPDGYYRAVLGLLALLPDDARWTARKRECWLEAMRAVVDLLVAVSEADTEPLWTDAPLTLLLIGDEPMPAAKVLRVTQDMLRLLAAIQRDLRRQRGIRGRAPLIPWSVDIETLPGRVEVRFAVPGDPEPWREC